MTGRKEKWQQALEKWSIWAESQQTARAEIEARYADKLPWIKDAKVEVQDTGDGSGGFRIRVYDEQWAKWEIETAVESIADGFVSGKMGLPSG